MSRVRTTVKHVRGVFAEFCKSCPPPRGMRWILNEGDVGVPWQLFATTADKDEHGNYRGGAWFEPIPGMSWNTRTEAWDGLRAMMRTADYLKSQRGNRDESNAAALHAMLAQFSGHPSKLTRAQLDACNAARAALEVK